MAHLLHLPCNTEIRSYGVISTKSPVLFRSYVRVGEGKGDKISLGRLYMKILVAEDDPVSRLILQKSLEKFGHEALCAENGMRAWELFQNTEVKMVITDWMMPEMDGMDLCKNIRLSSNDQYSYIIVLTAKVQKQDLIEMLETGADDYITKPFDPEELRVRIRTGERILRLEDEHNKFENILIESRNKLRTILDSLNEEIVSIDKDFNIVSVNRAFQCSRGVNFNDFIGRPYFDFIHDDANAIENNKMEDSIKKVFESGMPQSLLETPFDKLGNKRYTEVKCMPVKNESGSVFQVVVVAADITVERKKNEEIRILNRRLKEAFKQIKSKNDKLEKTLNRLKDTQSQMLQSEKMSSIGQLAAGVAHEINNPTGFVSSNLKTLSDYQREISMLMERYRNLGADIRSTVNRGRCPASIEEKADRIAEEESQVDIDFIIGDTNDLIKESLEGMERIEKIVIDLKDFAHPGEDELQLADINKNLASTLNIVWNELKYKSTVKKDYGDLPLIYCYPHQLNQVFMNILVNSAQAIEKRGEIKITTKSLNNHVEVKISDTGVGIPKENLSKIFDPFFTTKDVGKGTGLGMNVAYNIIKKHNGTIDVKSEAGKGTEFTVTIPMRQEK